MDDDGTAVSWGKIPNELKFVVSGVPEETVEGVDTDCS